jgi:FtsZ-binding cell division protein ZapB
VETTELKSREGSFDQTGNMHYSSDRTNLQHNQLEYLYDEHENWIERIVSFRSESKPNFQRSNIERRIINYYSA